ncbi:MAG: flagellar basal-body rod protein FlgF [Deltaproteobacteria bacterium]|nr:flagellar basal-body rod protein FlgF [Deltaproteobacteria bacterium]
MQASMYSGLFGAMTQEARLDVIANNLANANTTGFKKDNLAFRNTFRLYAHDRIDPNRALQDDIPWVKDEQLSMTRIGRHHVDFSQGGLRRTDNELDLALNGEGFLKVRTPDGDFYTRSGQFQLNAAGQVASASGNLLLGQAGPMTLEEGSRVQIDNSGGVYVNGELVDTLDVVSFEDLRVLEKIGDNLFRVRPEVMAQEIPAEGTMIEQGALESSNVEVVREMVNMIETLRIFEACQKSMQDSLQNDQKVMTEVGKTR